jgi:sugar lactone lactonase YvrE
MGVFTYFLRDLEQIVFPNRDQHPIPAMDGAYAPNDLLDHFRQIGAPIPGADDISEGPDGALYISAGNQIFRLAGTGFAERSVFATVDGMAGGLAFHPDGRLLVCVAGRGLVAIAPGGGQTWLDHAGDQPLQCLTDVIAAPDGTIFLTDGSTRHQPEDWLHDLMEKNHLGRLISCGPALEGAKVLLPGMHYPHGLGLSPDGKTLWFTESWNHRLSQAAITGQSIAKPRIVVGNMPGYPARLTRSTAGGFWLSVFAVRTHLVEFVLREDRYREEMMQSVPADVWIGPALSTSNDCEEPMQFGNIKALGIEKPWAPPRSYGLVVRIDEDGDAVESLHSRRGGTNHGITAARETPQGLVILSKGSGRLLLDITRSKT